MTLPIIANLFKEILDLGDHLIVLAANIFKSEAIGQPGQLVQIMADHVSANRELIQQVAKEGLKRSLENTFNEKE